MINEKKSEGRKELILIQEKIYANLLSKTKNKR